MSKLMSLNKQLEQLAKKWYINQYDKNDINSRSEEFENSKEFIIQRYLRTHPEVKNQYLNKKNTINKIKVRLAIGTVAVATLIGSYTLESISNQKSMESSVSIIDNEKTEDNNYEEFFEQIGKIKNTDKRHDFIHSKTKETIVEAYNSQNPDNKITSEELEILILGEYVLAEKDKLGNDISFERVPQNKEIKTNENQELKRIGNIYVYAIDGKTVATYDSNGQPIIDKSIEKEETFFKDTISILKASSKLEDLYKFPSNDREKAKGQKYYEQELNNLLQDEKVQLLQTQEIEK